jgi:hypothetical protein
MYFTLFYLLLFTILPTIYAIFKVSMILTPWLLRKVTLRLRYGAYDCGLR